MAKNNLAMVMLLQNKDLKAAQELAATAVATDPANSALHSTLGEVDQALKTISMRPNCNSTPRFV